MGAAIPVVEAVAEATPAVGAAAIPVAAVEVTPAAEEVGAAIPAEVVGSAAVVAAGAGAAQGVVGRWWSPLIHSRTCFFE